MPRPPIPSELRRAVLVEAGHRCAIPQCNHPDVDLHHITPWHQCRAHEYRNLIALCPNCHRRADRREIDRKSLREYKAKLVAAFAISDSGEFDFPAVEIKRKILNKETKGLAAGFDFEFPDFCNSSARIVSRTIESWGRELLSKYLPATSITAEDASWDDTYIMWVQGRYTVVRYDSLIISLLYEIELYPYRAAHRSTDVRVQNFSISPFQPLLLSEILQPETGVIELARVVKSAFGHQHPYLWSRGEDIPGLAPNHENFETFTFDRYGMNFHSQEYQLGGYAIGRPSVCIEYRSLKGILKDEIYALVTSQDGI